MKKIAHRARVLLLVLSGLLVIAGAWVGIVACKLRNTNLAELRTELAEWSTNVTGERVLVVAPHCDDETLGCGGLIEEMARRNIPVRVVIMTNGDGFYYAAARDFRDPVVPPASYVEFGCERQRESVTALKSLGLSRDSVIFLGYPDRGLAHIWLNHWQPSKLYCSPYTRDNYSPYPNSYRRCAPYCGRAVLGDLKEIIRSYRPTAIYYPHTADQHSDHWATNCFVTQALYELGMLDRRVRSGLYIVHRGDWPVPQGLHPGVQLAPPAALKNIGMHWYRLPLSSQSQERKLDAIRKYETQLPLLRRFLTSFARSTELFSTYRPGTSRRVQRISLRPDDPKWVVLGSSIEDAVSDDLDVGVARAGDLKSITCCYDSKNVYIRLNLAHKLSKRIVYNIHVHTVPDGHGRFINATVRKKKCITYGVQASVSANSIQLSVPQSRLGKWKALMVGADSTMGTYLLDRTPWRLLLPSGS